LHAQRFAYLYQEETIKREWGESPRLSRSCEPPLLSGTNNDATCL